MTDTRPHDILRVIISYDYAIGCALFTEKDLLPLTLDVLEYALTQDHVDVFRSRLCLLTSQRDILEWTRRTIAMQRVACFEAICDHSEVPIDLQPLVPIMVMAHHPTIAGYFMRQGVIIPDDFLDEVVLSGSHALLEYALQRTDADPSWNDNCAFWRAIHEKDTEMALTLYSDYRVQPWVSVAELYARLDIY
jgi:hypothetical protein